MPDRLAYKRKNAAAALDISVDYFDAHVRPHLRPVYIAGATRYRASELQEWLDREAS
jgi:hypothetical protein